MFQLKLPIRWVIDRIRKASENELNEMIQGLLQCYSRKNPEYELVILSLPIYDTGKRIDQIDMISDMLKEQIHTKTACMENVGKGYPMVLR